MKDFFFVMVQVPTPQLLGRTMVQVPTAQVLELEMDCNGIYNLLVMHLTMRSNGIHVLARKGKTFTNASKLLPYRCP